METWTLPALIQYTDAVISMLWPIITIAYGIAIFAKIYFLLFSSM